MGLVSAIALELGLEPQGIMLLRHSTAITNRLLSVGGSVDEYSAVQPIGSKYDYFDPDKPRISTVVVVVNDRIHGIYRVLGIEREGTTYTLTSDVNRHFDEIRQRPERPARKFRLEPLKSEFLGCRVRGWEHRSRTPVQRIDGGFFWEIEVDNPPKPRDSSELESLLSSEVKRALSDDPVTRQRRIAKAPLIPERVRVTGFAFLRNADVIAEVLLRARGHCEQCGSPAPFMRCSDGSPYLEVHHRIRLADGGEDSVGNALAVCPNCHRQAHHGSSFA